MTRSKIHDFEPVQHTVKTEQFWYGPLGISLRRVHQSRHAAPGMDDSDVTADYVNGILEVAVCLEDQAKHAAHKVPVRVARMP